MWLLAPHGMTWHTSCKRRMQRRVRRAAPHPHGSPLHAHQRHRLAAQAIASFPVWDVFTRYTNTFYRGPAVFAWGVASDEAECATACSQQQGCQQWTWCPSDTGDSG